MLKITNEQVKGMGGEFGGGGASGSFGGPVEKCSIRMTKDVVVVGWIDPAHVELSPAGMDRWMTAYYPPSGKITGPQKLLTLMHLGWLGFLGAIHPYYPRSMTRAERRYILHWMFKFAANDAPPGGFSGNKQLDGFARKFTAYKLYNRLQVGYYTGGTGAKSVLRQEALIGTTIDPILQGESPGEPEPDNGKPKPWIVNGKARSLNKGNPDWKGVRAFNTLASDLGRTWEYIGSLIIQALGDIKDDEVTNQNYPTYWIYERESEAGVDGPFVLTEKRVQAPSPEDHMVAGK